VRHIVDCEHISTAFYRRPFPNFLQTSAHEVNARITDYFKAQNAFVFIRKSQRPFLVKIVTNVSAVVTSDVPVPRGVALGDANGIDFSTSAV
jgi:hypothetical protein